jgi:hypothetical protein
VLSVETKLSPSITVVYITGKQTDVDHKICGPGVRLEVKEAPLMTFHQLIV